LEGEYGDE